MTSKSAIFNRRVTVPVEAYHKSIFISYFEKKWNSYSLWVKINILLKVLKIWPFLTSQSDMNSRTKSPENRDHPHTDTTIPASFMKLFTLVFYFSLSQVVWGSSGKRRGQNQYISRCEIWGYYNGVFLCVAPSSVHKFFTQHLFINPAGLCCFTYLFSLSISTLDQLQQDSNQQP